MTPRQYLRLADGILCWFAALSLSLAGYGGWVFWYLLLCFVLQVMEPIITSTIDTARRKGSA